MRSELRNRLDPDTNVSTPDDADLFTYTNLELNRLLSLAK